jgi:hypothetical protein
MTLIIGCGGSSTPKTDAGAKYDAKRDTSSADVKKTDGPAAIVDGRAAIPDGPAVTLDLPAAPVDVPAGNTDLPAARLDVQPSPADVPAAPVDVPAGNTDARLDLPPSPTDVPASPTDVAKDVNTSVDLAPVDGGTLPTDAGTPKDSASDVAKDSAPVADTAADAPAPHLDLAADSAEDTAAVEVAADAGAAADAGDGGCPGALCVSFEGRNPDAGLPSSLTVVTPAAGEWDLTVDQGNTVLEQTAFISTPSFVSAGVNTWTDQTIQVRVKLHSVGGDGSATVCGRFTVTGTATPPNIGAYCMEISSGAGAGNVGSITVTKLASGVVPTILGSPATSLAIALDTWHSYKLTISGGTSGATIKAYLDGATTASVQVLDSSAVQTAGGVALGAANAQAEFDDLLVTTP